MMKLLEATQIAMELESKLRPYCDRIEVVGSIRRGRADVKDIDIVAIPNEEKLMVGGYFGRRHLVGAIASSNVTQNGKSVASFLYGDAPVDIYWATPETWGTLLLIRTGSKQHNIKLCMMAKKKGWQLKASGEGLFDAYNRRVAGSTEEGIFNALDLPFIPPGERE